jgi:transposase
VDECATHTSMNRLRARAPKGQRAYAKVPRNRGKNTTLLASMTSEGMGPCMAVVGSTTKALFEAYVDRVLAPSLRPGQVVVMDNLGAHRGERIRALVGARGCSLVYLPPYSSPEFSPIEEAFSKIKTLLRKANLRKAKARTRVALLEAIGRALWAITPQDAVGYFVHCGYPLDAQPS